MQAFEKIDAYVSLLCEQIRWKKARPVIREEIKSHILDQRDAYMAQGLEEDAATEKAIADTGDAVAIGAQLDRMHRPKAQWGMLAAVGVLLLIGLFIQLLIFHIEDKAGLILSIIIGAAVMLAAYFSDFSVVGRYPKTVYFAVTALGVAAVLFAPVRNGALDARYVALLFPLAFAAIVFVTKGKGYIGIILCGLAFALPACIILYIPSFSAFFLYTIACTVILSTAILKNWFGIKRRNGILLMLAPMIAVPALFLLLASHDQWQRLAVALNLAPDPAGRGFIGDMSRELLQGARLFNTGNLPFLHRAIMQERAVLFQSDLTLTAVTALWG